MSQVNRRFLIVLYVPPDLDNLDILEPLDESFNGRIVLLIDKRCTSNMMVPSLPKVDAKQVRVDPCFYDVLFKTLKEKMDYDYVLFMDASWISLPLETMCQPDLPPFTVAPKSDGSIEHFFISKASLIKSYKPTRDPSLQEFVTFIQNTAGGATPVIPPFFAYHRPPFPSWLYIEVTTRCNLNCSYCNRKFATDKDGIMTLEQFQSILDKFPNIDGVNIIGLGEPLLHPQIKEIFKLIKNKNIHSTVTINGTLLTDDIIEAFPPYMTVYFSMDGIKKDGVWYQARKIDVEDVCNRIRRLRQLRPNIPIVLQPVVVKGFLNELAEYIMFAQEINADIHPALPVLPDKEEWLKYFPEPSELAGIIRLLSSYPKAHNRLTMDASLLMCFDPYRLLMITVDGQVYCCCFQNTIRIYNSECFGDTQVKFNVSDLKLGNVFSDSVESIMSNPKLKEMRRKVLNPNLDGWRKRPALYTPSNPTDYCHVCLNRWNRGC